MKIIGLFLVAFLFWGGKAQSQSSRKLEKNTYLYAVRETDSLYLDKYTLPGSRELKPCILFVFGGGFVGGERDAEIYLPYFQYLTERGYVVVSIDYRLGLKAVAGQKGITPDLFIPQLETAVRMAVEDLYTATAFVLERAEEWSIDREQIIANGSSAGAITVLQGEYWLCNQADQAMAVLPDFQYAGIISFAGAILDFGPDLKWKGKPAPMQLFQGDADGQVPYGKIGNEQGSFFGSGYIAEQLTLLEIPHYFCIVLDAGHEIAGTPMYDYRQEIDIFLTRLVRLRQSLMIDTEVSRIGRTTLKKDFQLTDYINNNFK